MFSQHSLVWTAAIPLVWISLLRDFLCSAGCAKLWIQDALHRVQNNFLDGIVFDCDFEVALPAITTTVAAYSTSNTEGHTYATLISETRTAFHRANPSLQITTCVPWSPDNIDGRAYPYREISDASDLLYVMDYDTRSQVFDTCIAGSNAPLPGMIQGMHRWFDSGVLPEMVPLSFGV